MPLSLVKTRPPATAGACPACGQPIDPLRAGRVALLGEKFHYFCDETCSARYLAPHASRFAEETQEPPRVAPAVPPEPIEAPPSGPVARIPLPAESTRSLVARRVHAEPKRVRPSRKLLPFLLTVLPLSASLIAASSAQLGERGARVALSAIVFAFALEVAFAGQTRRRLTLRALVSFLPLVAVLAIAVLAQLGHQANASAILPTAGLVVFGYVALRALGARLHQATLAEVATLRAALETNAKYTGDRITLTGPAMLPVDGLVTSGRGDVHPNGARGGHAAVVPGSLVFAGGKLARGEIELQILRSGDTRYLSRLFGHGDLRAIWPARYASIERLLLFGTVLASLTVGLFAWVSREASWLPFLLAATLASVVGMLHRVELPRLMWARGVLGALERGVVFPSFDRFDRASFVDQVVLAGRGVVFAGVPTFVELVWLGAELDRDAVSAEIAGAEAVSTHPFGAAFRAALLARGVEPQKPRRVEEFAGLGVVARTRQNADLVIGNRELLLRYAVSVAGAEARAAELEAERQELLYVARDGRLVGYAVFEDGVREGCFEAVQDILAAGMEPVMLGGSSQAVCEAAGRALEIEHVRAEVLPEDRAAVIRSLIESGRVVAMVGTLPRDEDALLEADVAIAFGTEGVRAEGALARSSREDLRAAAQALAGARVTREQLGKMLLVALLLPLCAGLAAGFGLASPALVPLAGLSGLGAALFLGRRTLFSERNTLPKGRVAE